MVIVVVPCFLGLWWEPFHMAEIYGLYMLLTNYLLTGMILQVWHARVSLNAWKIGDKLIPTWKKRILMMGIYRQLI